METNVITIDETCPYCGQAIKNAMHYFAQSLYARFSCPFCARTIDGWINPIISLEKAYLPETRVVVTVLPTPRRKENKHA